MILDAKGNPIELTIESSNDEEIVKQIPSFNFPPPTPQPEWFQGALNKIGGFADPGTNKIPNYRVVWGMDPNLVEFAMGGFHMKYITIIDLIETVVGYNIVDTQKGTHTFMKAEKAHRIFQDPDTKQMTKNIKPGVIIVPVVKTEEREIGRPLWVAEYFMRPEGFGTEKDWEANRYMTNPEDAKHYIDVLGPYPKQGRYLEWFDIVDYDEEGRPTYRDLDEGALEMIRANHVFNVARRKNMVYDTPEARANRKEARLNDEWNKFDGEITKEILDIKRNRRFNTPGIINPGRG